MQFQSDSHSPASEFLWENKQEVVAVRNAAAGPPHSITVGRDLCKTRFVRRALAATYWSSTSKVAGQALPLQDLKRGDFLARKRF